MPVKRLRGLLLRLVRRRLAAGVLGAAMLSLAIWLELGTRWSAWWVDGLSLVSGATGAAFLWTSLAGPRPDWVDPFGPGH